MCDKQALRNELWLSCRHAHAFPLTQSPSVPLPHEQLQRNIYKAQQRLGSDMDGCTHSDSLPGSTREVPKEPGLTAWDPQGPVFLLLLLQPRPLNTHNLLLNEAIMPMPRNATLPMDFAGQAEF